MPGAPHSPLDDTHLAQINAMMNQIQIAKAQLDLMKRAQLPGWEDRERAIQEQEATLSRIKNVYFPMSV